MKTSAMMPTSTRVTMLIGKWSRILLAWTAKRRLQGQEFE
jgi:hypothetical protein